MNTAVTYKPAQFVVNIDDVSLVNDIRRAIKMIRGVGSVHLTRKKAKSEVELSLEEAHNGKVTHWNSVDDYFKTILAK